MQENLKQFIRQQALRGERPEKLREGLILNGWDAKDVDQAIKEVYGIKKRISKTVIILSIILVLVFTTSLTLIFNELYFDEDLQEETDEKTNKDNINKEEIDDDQSELAEDESCAGIENINEKENCYLNEIKDGYDCSELSEDEEFYCMRTLEAHLLSNIES